MTLEMLAHSSLYINVILSKKTYKNHAWLHTIRITFKSKHLAKISGRSFDSYRGSIGIFLSLPGVVISISKAQLCTNSLAVVAPALILARQAIAFISILMMTA